MGLTIKNAYEAQTLLNELVRIDDEVASASEFKNGFLPFQTKLAINTRLRKLKADVDTFNSERLAVFKELGEPILDKKGDNEKPITTGYSQPTDPEKLELFLKRLECIHNSEAELETLKPLTIESLGKNPPLSAALIAQLQDHGVLEQTPEEKE